MFCFLPATTAMAPTDLSTTIQDCVALAIADSRGPNRLKGAADDMGITLPMLSEGLKGEKHLSLQRLTNLGPVFLLHFCKRVMAHLGGVALSADEVALLRGAAALGTDHVQQLTEKAVA